jgi:hypothetical protein
LKWAVDPVADVVTTAGDLLYATAADTVTRLGIGTAGQVLKVNSGATAPEWGAAAAGGANWSLVNAGGTALTGASTITISGITNANQLLLLVTGASCVNASQPLMTIRLNGDTGSNYRYAGGYMNLASAYSDNAIQSWSNFTTSSHPFCYWSDSATSLIAGYAMISGGNSSGLKTIQSFAASTKAGSSNPYFVNNGGFYDSASTISSISVVSQGGNFDAGTMYVYQTA